MFVLRWRHVRDASDPGNKDRRAARGRDRRPEAHARLPRRPGDTEVPQTSRFVRKEGSSLSLAAGSSLTERGGAAARRSRGAEERVRRIGGWGNKPFGREEQKLKEKKKTDHVFGDQRRSAL